MKIGCHVSIAGGIQNAPQRAGELGCEVFQIFSRSPRGGAAPKITDQVAKEFKEAMALIIFGSVLREKSYNDIDVMIITSTKKIKVLEKKVDEKNKILTKPLHPIWQTTEDLRKNTQKRNKVILEILKTGVVFKGQELITEVLARVTRRE